MIINKIKQSIYMLIILFIAIVPIMFSGCHSIPETPNITGKWNYTLRESANSNIFLGKMTLMHNEYFEVTGIAEDIFGKNKVSGIVATPQFVLKFSSPDKTIKNTINVKMTSCCTFSGTFRASNGKRGTIKGKKLPQ